MLEMVNERTKAILLLTSYFNKSEVKMFKLLTTNEYGYLARWLHHYKYSPTDLLNRSSLERIFSQWDNSSSHTPVKEKIDFKRLDNTIQNINSNRISQLVGRGASMSMALEKWGKSGIWIMDRSDEHYPAIFKKQLKDQAPAIIFGVGKKELLREKAIGFVGSRDIDGKDIAETIRLVSIANKEGYSVVSGGAKGVDITAMSSSLVNGYGCIGILTDNLFRNSANSIYRQHLKNNSLVLITPFFPESSFTPINAMSRNKFIYLLSEMTVVVKSGVKGGTWSGAIENIKKNWVPLLVVKNDSSNYEGNQKLLANTIKQNQQKPLSVTSAFSSFVDIFKHRAVLSDSMVQPIQVELFEENSDSVSIKPSLESIKDKYDIKKASSMVIKEQLNAYVQKNFVEKPLVFYQESSIFDIFYYKVQLLISDSKMKSIKMSELENDFPEFQVMGKLSLSKWVAQLVKEGKLVRHGRKKIFSLPLN